MSQNDIVGLVLFFGPILVGLAVGVGITRSRADQDDGYRGCGVTVLALVAWLGVTAGLWLLGLAVLLLNAGLG
jgi:hypothetical protein